MTGRCLPLRALALAVLLGGAAAAGPASDPEAVREAREILDASGVQGGVIIHVGCGDGHLTAALHAGSQYIVQGLERDPASIARARQHLKSLGIRGPVSIDTYGGRHLPYADGFVNLVVAKQLGDLPAQEVMRVLCPGGALCVFRGGRWQATRKPWPDDIDEWTHYLHGPDGNAVARDLRVGPPRHLQWIAPPRWLRHHNMTISFSAMVSAGGRIFYIADDSPPGIVGLPERWNVVARDAFNGTLLWRRPLADWGWPAWTGTLDSASRSRFDGPLDVTRRLVAGGGRVFVAPEHAPVRALDTATGKVVRTYPGTERLSELLLIDGLLVASVHRAAPGVSGKTARRGKPAPLYEEAILAFDADSGALRWKKTGFRGVAAKTGPLHPYTQLYLTADARRVYLLDHDNVVSLDLRTGDELWRTARPEHKETVAKYASIITSNLCTLVLHGDVVLFGQLAAYPKNPWYTPSSMTLLALSASTGKELWRFPAGNWNCYSPPDVFVIDGLVWTHSRGEPYELLGLDPETGNVKRRISTAKAMVAEHHHRCYRNKATSRFILTGRRGVELTDLHSGRISLNHWIRGACRYGILPANGLLYAPPDPCICYITAKVNGLAALAPGPARKGPVAAPPRLERGPAYGRPLETRRDATGAWPTYRHDARRTGATAEEIPTALEPRWHVDTGGKLSAPVVAGGRLLAAAVDRHAVIAFDARSGKALWDFTCAGRIDSPPTIHRGLALFGSADGYVYALRADDGRLAWRFRAAAGERRIGSFGQMESAWPVRGSVLVREGVVYFASGRSSFLDGGITVYALDPATGRVLQQHTLSSVDPATGEGTYDKRLRYDMPPDHPGALSDVLVSEGRYIFMRHVRMDPLDLSRDMARETPAAEIQDVYRRQIPRVVSPGPQVACTAGLLEENWFNQTYWSFAGRSQCRLLACDEKCTYGVRAYPGRPARHSRAKFLAGKSTYTLFADRRRPRFERIWSHPLPVRVGAMLIARDKLLVAGAPAAISPDDPRAAEEGRGPGVLSIFSASDGKEIRRVDLAAPVVWNGIAAAGGRVYISLKNGRIVCLAAR